MKDSSYKVIIDAGAIQGINPAEWFSVHEKLPGGSFSEPLASVCTTDVGMAHSEVELDGDPSTDIPSVFYAKLEYTDRETPIFVERGLREWVQELYSPEVDEADEVNTDVDDPAHATLEFKHLVFGNGEEVVTVERTNAFGQGIINDYAPSDFGLSFRKDEHEAIRAFVKQHAHFVHHLYRPSPEDELPVGVESLFDHVSMELHMLEPLSLTAEGGTDVMKPIGRHFLGNEPTVVEVDVPEPSPYYMEPNQEKLFGLTIVNEGHRPLYPYLFVCDPTELTICALCLFSAYSTH